MQTTAHTYTSTQLGGLVAQYVNAEGATVRAIATPSGSYAVDRQDANAVQFERLPLTQWQARCRKPIPNAGKCSRVLQRFPRVRLSKCA